MAGRKSKATDPRIEACLNALRAGNTRGAASTFAGISRTTLYRWLEDDVAFRDSVEKAEADAEVRYASQIARAATDGTWQAAAWWLERRRHQEYSRRERVDMQLEVRSVIEGLTDDPNERAAALAEVNRILAESR